MKKLISVILLILFLGGCTQIEDEPEIKRYTVTYITNGGSEVSQETVVENSFISQPSTSKPGFIFKGWFKDANFEESWDFETEKVTSDISLYAKWEEEEIEIINEPMEDIFEKLYTTIYKQEISYQDEDGLDPKLMGIDQDKFENEIRYPVPTENGINVYNVSEHNILTTHDDNTTYMNILLNEIKNVDGIKIIKFSEGIYRFKETITITEIEDLYLVGENTTWLMTSWLTLIKVVEATNFHINNINFDYEISPSIMGTIHSTNPLNNEVVIKVDDEFDLTNHRYTNGKINRGNYMEYVYDEKFAAYIPDANGMLRYNSTGDQVNGIEDGSYDPLTKQLTLKFNNNQGAFKAPAKGKVVSAAFTMYEYPGFVIEKCVNTYFETVSIYTTPGMSIMGKSSENLYFNRTNIMLQEGSKRLMTATADGLHLGDCIGEVVVSNSVYEASHDDSINIKTFYFTVDSFLRKKMTVSMTTTEIRIPINVGDVIEIFDSGTLLGKLTRTVVSVENYGTSYEIEFDRNISSSAINVGDLAGNLSRVPSVSIENNIFRNKRNRGILLQTRNSQIINNVFYNILHGPIMIHAAKDIFSEAIVPKNILVANNKFYQNNKASGTAGDVAVFRSGGPIVEDTITNVDIKNNYFNASHQSAIFLQGTGTINILNNLIDRPRVDADGYGIKVVKTKDSVIKNTILKLDNPNNEIDCIKIVESTNVNVEEPIKLNEEGS